MRYKALLGFIEFHVAQRLVEKNPIESLIHFKNVLINIQNILLNDSWKAYVEGTILYMEGKEIPETIIGRVESERNAQILRNFNEGLKKRGFPNYNDDYIKK